MMIYRIRIIPDVSKFDDPGGYCDFEHINASDDIDLIVQDLKKMNIEFADSVPVQWWYQGKVFLWRYTNVALVTIKDLPGKRFACGMKFGPFHSDLGWQW